MELSLQRKDEKLLDLDSIQELGENMTRVNLETSGITLRKSGQYAIRCLAKRQV